MVFPANTLRRNSTIRATISLTCSCTRTFSPLSKVITVSGLCSTNLIRSGLTVSVELLRRVRWIMGVCEDRDTQAPRNVSRFSGYYLLWRFLCETSCPLCSSCLKILHYTEHRGVQRNATESTAGGAEDP